MRIPYVDNPPDFTSPEDIAVVERVKQRRGTRGLIPLDLALLHAPPVADGWNSFLRAIRTSTSLSASLRETVICRVAVLNRAWFEWEHHTPILIRDGGMADAGVQTVFSAAPSRVLQALNGGGEKLAVPEDHTLVLAYADALTLNAAVPDDVFARMKATFTEREIVEITTTIGAYNCVSRFLSALDVGERNGSEGMSIAVSKAGGVESGTEPAPRSY